MDAYHHFADPEWDGDPVAEDPCAVCGEDPCVCVKESPKPCPKCGESPCVCEKTPKVCPVCGMTPCVCENPVKQKLKIKLRDGKEREIQHMISTSFWSADGKPISVEEFMNNLFGAMPEYFQSEDELRKIWSDPVTRRTFLDKIAEIGYGKDELEMLQKVVDAEDSDLLDVLSYVSFMTKPISRKVRVAQTKHKIYEGLNDEQKAFVDFVMAKYEERGVEELEESKLPVLLNLKYQAIANAEQSLGSVDEIRSIFFEFQQELYA